MENKNEEARIIPERKRVKVYRSKKGYDRTRDRKDKRLYIYDRTRDRKDKRLYMVYMEEENNDGIVEKSQGVFQGRKSRR